MLEQHEAVIVIEDDLLLSPYFLKYMNDALYHYRDDQRVASIHGYSLPPDRPLPETYFLKGADCWGWATWRRAGGGFDPEGRADRESGGMGTRVAVRVSRGGDGMSKKNKKEKHKT